MRSLAANNIETIEIGRERYIDKQRKRECGRKKGRYRRDRERELVGDEKESERDN